MSISSEQALEAKIFLTLYKEAIVALKQSAIRDSDNEVIEDFTNRIIRIYDNKIFRRICNPNDNFLSAQNITKHFELARNVRSFQFSHYAFLKYLPKFMKFEGNGTDVVVYMKAQNAELKRELDS